jgi:signal transduction histidine kinase
VAQALRGELLSGPAAVDIHVRTPNGREVELRVSGAPLRDHTGQIIGAVCVYLDQTEGKQLEREREEARANERTMREVNLRLDTFVAMAAHDLRSPVAVSRMVVQVALQRLQQASTHAHSSSGRLTQAVARAAVALETTAGNLERLWRLVQQLLDVSRVRQGTFVLNRQRLQLADAARASIEEQRLLNPERTIELDLSNLSELTDPGAEAISVDADADRLGQVLSNYLANAVRYSPEDQPIVVSLRVAEEQVARPQTADDAGTAAASPGMEPAVECPSQRVARVEVRDHGMGISREEQATIWDRFQRAKNVSEASGLGLGLYIARMIVEMHGGNVGVESEPGQGSTFWFTLPLAPTDVKVQVAAAPTGDQSAAS